MLTQKKRTAMQELDPKERIHSFDEVALGYDHQQAVKEASRCIQCKKPTCVDGCPVGIDIPGFILALCQYKLERSSQILKEANSLPAICGRVCPQETQCEKTCVLQKIPDTDPVAIGRLERYVADWEAQHPLKPEQPGGSKKGKVAVVGSGPAGLTCASELAKKGFRVTLFEALHAPGGVLTYGIPEFRLPKAIVDREVQMVLDLGVELQTNMIIGQTLSLQEVIDAFDAVFLGIGTGTPKFMGVEGTNLNGVMSSSEFLTRINLMKSYAFPRYDTPLRVTGKVMVIGGGNVAIDCARSALRCGAESVSIVYRRTKEELPARAEEVDHAIEEGVNFIWLSAPEAYIGASETGREGWLCGVRVQKMRLGDEDDSGRRRPVPISGEVEEQEVDMVIEAIGQTANQLLFSSFNGIQRNRWGNIEVLGDDGDTSVEGIYAGGDIVTGSATVIEAMGAGKRAAQAIARYITQNSDR